MQCNGDLRGRGGREVVITFGYRDKQCSSKVSVAANAIT